MLTVINCSDCTKIIAAQNLQENCTVDDMTIQSCCDLNSFTFFSTPPVAYQDATLVW